MEFIVNRASVYNLCYVDIVVSAVSCIRKLYYVHIVGNVDFFLSRLQYQCACALFSSLLCSQNFEIIYTRFHAFYVVQ